MLISQVPQTREDRLRMYYQNNKRRCNKIRNRIRLLLKDESNNKIEISELQKELNIIFNAKPSEDIHISRKGDISITQKTTGFSHSHYDGHSDCTKNSVWTVKNK